MRKVGILSDIIKRYETKEEVECAGPKVFYYEFFNYLYQLGQRWLILISGIPRTEATEGLRSDFGIWNFA